MHQASPPMLQASSPTTLPVLGSSPIPCPGPSGMRPQGLPTDKNNLYFSADWNVLLPSYERGSFGVQSASSQSGAPRAPGRLTSQEDTQAAPQTPSRDVSWAFRKGVQNKQHALRSPEDRAGQGQGRAFPHHPDVESRRDTHSSVTREELFGQDTCPVLSGTSFIDPCPPHTPSPQN